MCHTQKRTLAYYRVVVVTKLLLVNVYLDLNDESNYFLVDRYKIYPSRSNETQSRNFRKHNKNAFVEFSGKQRSSLLFEGGVVGNKKNYRKRKLLDDILVIGSILDGWNWALYSRRNFPCYPAISQPYLEGIDLVGKNDIEECFNKILNKIMNNSWKKQYENGFHLRMLLNRANIINHESGFLSNVVIWEWLYPHLKNPNGAMSNDKNYGLIEIINSILRHFWLDNSGCENEIFYVLRNQLAHSGRLPINSNRRHVEDLMKKLKWERSLGKPGILDYILFFDKLTQTVVLKTLDINANIIGQRALEQFLRYGKL
jgi:hypothetical protein